MRVLYTIVLAVAAGIVLIAARPSGGHTVVTATPGLQPRFHAVVEDYVSRCDPAQPLRLHVKTGGDEKAAVDGRHARSGTFDVPVTLKPGQGTQVVVRSGDRSRTYHVRCLPRDFPRWTFTRFRRPQAQWFLFAPQQGSTQPPSHFVVMIDGHGTPVWWRQRAATPFNSHLLSDGTIVWGRWFDDPFGYGPRTRWEVHTIDGPLLRTLRTAGSSTDMHDIRLLPNGHYLICSYRIRRHVDTSDYKGKEDGAVADAVIQEVDRAGHVHWSWDSKDHVRLSEMTHWWRGTSRTLPGGLRVLDYFHLNSFAPDGHGGLLVSGRHVDAIYRIDVKTGRVTWKLGGTKRPTSLRVIGNTRPDVFIGQHDVQLLPDGTLTAYDNHVPGRPRAIHFSIDAHARTARVIGEVSERSLVWSPAEGSATLLPGRDWVVSWGASRLLEELPRTNDPTWRLTLAAGQSYRIQPIPYGTLSAARLRAAMDRMHPR